MSCEMFLKYIISRTSVLRKDHIHSHSVWGLACDAEMPHREKYRTLLRKLGDYYSECRYENDDIETKQSVIDYFLDDSIFDEADSMLFELYSYAKDVERSASLSADMRKPVNTMNLFGGK